MDNVKIDIAVVNGINERGCESPKSRYSSLTINPTNIEEAKLKPTDIKKVLRILSSLSLKVLRITKPGKNDKYANTKTSLTKAIFRQITAIKNSVKNGMTKMSFLVFKSSPSEIHAS
jgi:hypothetical protein